ncbi:class I SAM-dependent methyltransferase [Amycolatopsis thermalba]|uniref:class I SAM-dependent methyltransferase n=1 Tax=Amycolatopsis thermalba TaxID=944492 RepID=UPI000E222612|nr:class I SAM-dependent methyltransferase [Amycolatopsis thermalba]
MSTCADTPAGYVFAGAGATGTDDPRARQHQWLAAAYDPLTTRRLAATGAGPGWRCLDVGAGGGSVSRWLVARVAPSGGVVATDLDPGHVGTAAGLVVQRHDVVTDPLPEAAFDLVHARLVLRHLPRRAAVLGKLARALRPGGWLQIDEFDTGYGPCLLAPGPAARRRYEEFRAAVATVMRAAGAEPGYGAHRAEEMRAAGLTGIDVHAEVTVWHAGSPGLRLLLHTSHHLRDRLAAAGLTGEHLADVRRVMTDPGFRAVSPVMYSVHGRRAS